MQLKEASLHSQITVKYCVKTSCWNAKLDSDSNEHLSLKDVEFGSFVHVQNESNVLITGHAFSAKVCFRNRINTSAGRFY